MVEKNENECKCVPMMGSSKNSMFAWGNNLYQNGVTTSIWNAHKFIIFVSVLANECSMLLTK